MPDLRQSHTNTSTRTRSRSRPTRPNSPQLHQLFSSQFPDDHSVYHHEDGEGGVHVDSDANSLHKTETERRRAETPESESESSSDEVDPSEKDVEDAGDRGESTIEEIRGGVPNERDVEAQPKLEKKKSSRSIKDPNLVGTQIHAYTSTGET